MEQKDIIIIILSFVLAIAIGLIFGLSQVINDSNNSDGRLGFYINNSFNIYESTGMLPIGTYKCDWYANYSRLEEMSDASKGLSEVKE